VRRLGVIEYLSAAPDRDAREPRLAALREDLSSAFVNFVDLFQQLALCVGEVALN
jgi:hypothetical protein